MATRRFCDRCGKAEDVEAKPPVVVYSVSLQASQPSLQGMQAQMGQPGVYKDLCLVCLAEVRKTFDKKPRRG